MSVGLLKARGRRVVDYDPALASPRPTCSLDLAALIIGWSVPIGDL